MLPVIFTTYLFKLILCASDQNEMYEVTGSQLSIQLDSKGFDTFLISILTITNATPNFLLTQCCSLRIILASDYIMRYGMVYRILRPTCEPLVPPARFR